MIFMYMHLDNIGRLMFFFCTQNIVVCILQYLQPDILYPLNPKPNPKHGSVTFLMSVLCSLSSVTGVKQLTGFLCV